MNKIIIIISIVFLMASCKHEPLIEEIPEVLAECDSTDVSFSATIVPILDATCVNCHTGSGAEGNVWLDNYADIKIVVEDSTLLGSIKHLVGFVAMPEVGKLDSCKIAKIENWISEGALNN